MEEQVKIFVSYSHQNNDWVDDDGKYPLIPWLKKQLRRRNVHFWTDHILADHIGEDYKINIKKNIDDSDIALLLISQEFSTSDFILDFELPWIKEAFDTQKIAIIPLLITKISKFGQENISWIFDLQTIPNNTIPIIKYTQDDVSWDDIKITICDALASKIKAIREAKNKFNELFDKGKEYYDKKDYNSAIDCFQPLAIQGYVTAQYQLGLSFDRKEDEKAAAEWFRKAAEQGHAEAQDNLGDLYYYGQGVEKNDEIAAEWFRKAAEQGLASAQNNLGLLYYEGQGVEKNDEIAAEWFRKAAEQGYALAQNNLGLCYKYGQGVKKNYKIAEEWLKKADENLNQ